MKKIPKAVISRLPKYYRYTEELLSQGIERVSSCELSVKLNSSASQVRQDLNMFGNFGQQGYGYNVKHLHTEIGNILGLNQCHNMIIVGAGNLGQALVNYTSFEKNGFLVKGMFDINPRLIGLVIRGIEIQSIDIVASFILKNNIQIAALAVPKNRANEIVPVLIDAGIQAIWNFVQVDLDVPDHIVVENVHLSESLMCLSYKSHVMIK